MDEHYLFLSSDFSKIQHPANKPEDFTVELPQPYVLSGQWSCALKEIQIPVEDDIVYVCSDMCCESYAENTMVPILRALQKPKGKNLMTFFLFNDPSYVPIKPAVLNRVRIFIRGSELKRLQLRSMTVRCTLHLKRWK